MALMQPQGEPEANVQALHQSWQKIMAPPPAPVVATPEEGKAEVSDIPAPRS